jgi:hypothetical protein
MTSLTPPALLLRIARLCLSTTAKRSACSATAAARRAWSKRRTEAIDVPAAAQQSSSYASVLKIKWNKLAPN